ncbi:hypothetical protein SRHO_G00248810 [Serrasalmus rhombeus]
MENDLGSTGDPGLDRAVRQWLDFDQNAKTAACVREMVKNGAVDELKKCFGARMEFGTAGLRAAMGPGVSRMNDLTIIQTTQGFCRYLEQCFADLKERGVVIGFDAREHTASGGSSKRFASLAAAVLISRGVPVYLFSVFTPTPYVPFTVSHLGLCAGIMVTASHNPKQDNGYKVYWENGAQIIPPHDKGIAAAIEENLEPWPEEYLQSIQQHCFHREVNKCSEVKIVHTSVHGVGHVFVQAAFKAFDLRPPYAVKEQKDPDPEFPTVEYPNPEEGAGVLNLSFALADREGATVVFANDPDADRLAVAEKQPRILPTSKSSQMITFTFANGGVATMRTSGTEPKIKYYTELCAAPGNSDLNQLNAELNNLVDAIVENFFQPKKNNLTPRPDS